MSDNIKVYKHQEGPHDDKKAQARDSKYYTYCRDGMERTFRFSPCSIGIKCDRAVLISRRFDVRSIATAEAVANILVTGAAPILRVYENENRKFSNSWDRRDGSAGRERI